MHFLRLSAMAASPAIILQPRNGFVALSGAEAVAFEQLVKFSGQQAESFGAQQVGSFLPGFSFWEPFMPAFFKIDFNNF